MSLTEDLGETMEGILVADIDLDDILKTKSFLDLCGHYSRQAGPTCCGSESTPSQSSTSGPGLEQSLD